MWPWQRNQSHKDSPSRLVSEAGRCVDGALACSALADPRRHIARGPAISGILKNWLADLVFLRPILLHPALILLARVGHKR